MATVEEMTAQLEALRGLRADGIRRGRFGEDEVEFRSDAELAAAIADLERRIDAATTPRSRIIYPRASKGY